MNLRREDGIALIVALMAMMLMTALGMALILTTSTETMIAGNFRNGQEALYAADAAVERTMDDLLTVPDWNTLLDGTNQSAYTDGSCAVNSATCPRTLPDGSTIDLAALLTYANCGRTVGTCSPADLTSNATGDRPWGGNNPVWRLYAFARLNDIIPTGTVNSPFYVVVMVGDDPAESDADPLHDGVTPCAAGVPKPLFSDPPGSGCNEGSGVLALRAEAFGPHGAHKVLEMTVARTDSSQLERGYTGQRGQDEQNRRARKASVQSPGKALTNQALSLSAGGIS